MTTWQKERDEWIKNYASQLPGSFDYAEAVKCCEFGRAYEAERTKKLEMIKKAVDAQSEDETIWFVANHIGEAHLQQSLRWLHRVIEYGNEDALQSILKQRIGDI